jgi:uncharacterized membrane protein YgcG
LFGKSWLFLTLLVFITSQSVLKHIHKEEEREDAERWAIALCRLFIYLLSMTQLIYTHMRDTIHAYRTKATVKFCGILPIPKYLKQWQDAASFCLTISLVTMLALEPIAWCWEHNGGKLFREECVERENLKFTYSLATMISMFLYYALLLDLTVVSTNISAFVLVCVRVMSEVGLFLSALFAAILTFSSAISVLKQESDQFAGIHAGAYSLFRMVLGMYDAERYAEFREEPMMLGMVIIFLIFTVIFLVSLLIAQLSCAYSAVYADMVGYARLERGQIIVEIMPSISKTRWLSFVSSLRLNKRVEFNEGDIGVTGGIQVKEPASLNPTTADMIRRFGGSTSPEIQWPEEEAQDGDSDDRFERLEKLIQRTLQRVNKSGGHSKRGRNAGGGSSMDMSGTGTGSKQESGSKSSSGGDDDDEV